MTILTKIDHFEIAILYRKIAAFFKRMFNRKTVKFTGKSKKIEISHRNIRYDDEKEKN